jgi:hypothetical protein
MLLEANLTIGMQDDCHGSLSDSVGGRASRIQLWSINVLQYAPVLGGYTCWKRVYMLIVLSTGLENEKTFRFTQFGLFQLFIQFCIGILCVSRNKDVNQLQ